MYILSVIFVCDYYNYKKVNFRLFNAYKKYKVIIKVKDEDSAITVSTKIGLSGCYQLNSILFVFKKVYEKIRVKFWSLFYFKKERKVLMKRSTGGARK